MKKNYLKIILFFLVAGLLAIGSGILVANYKIKQAKKLQSADIVNTEPGNSQVAESNDIASEANKPAEPASPPENIPTDTIVDSPDNNINKPFSFAVIGDTKAFSASNLNGNLQKAVQSITKQNVDLTFVMGDLVSSCDGKSSCEGKYNDWKKVMSSLLPKTYEIVGNHDRTGGSAADAMWQKEFNLPTNGPAGFSELTYSFDSGNSHFVVLDSEKPEEHLINDVQRNWLDQDLAKNKKENTFVFFHEPAFQMSQDSKDALDAKPGERDALWNILKKYKVTAVFNGHLHMTAGKNQDGIHQFVIGDTDSTADDTPQKNLTDFGLTGHYYAIVSVNGKTVDLKVYSLDGSMVKDYSFAS
jgi:UDP-2,3-diacylglucosamine pyrophosphatase LpxH